jgi:hypothetical protein
MSDFFLWYGIIGPLMFAAAGAIVYWIATRQPFGL